MDSKPALKMRKFDVRILVVPTQVEVALYGAKSEEKMVTIEGYTLKDAKKRAGIK
jgi:hypothetical protein